MSSGRRLCAFGVFDARPSDRGTRVGSAVYSSTVLTMNNEKLQPVFLISILVGSFLLAFLIFKPFLIALSLAAVFSVVLHPVYKRILLAMPGWQSAAAGVTMLVCLVCILVPLSFLILRIVGEAQQLYASMANGSGTLYLSTVVQSFQEFVRVHVPGMQSYTASVPLSADVYARGALTWIVQHLGDAFSSVTSVFLNTLVFLFALYYLLRDGRQLKRSIIELSPLRDTDDRLIFTRLELAVNSIIKGNLTIALIQGVQIAIGFTLFGVPNPILWGAVGSISALIPGIGTMLVLIPAIAFLFVTGSTVPSLGLLIWGLFAVGLIDNFLGPRLVGHGAQLHPLVVLLSVLGGVAFFGPVGVFFGPLCISLLFALLSIYANPSKNSTL